MPVPEHHCEHCDEHDMVPGSLAQRFKDERNIARAENERLRDALEHAAEYLSIIDTAKGRSAIGGIIREALNA